jgi:L-alanine-DL-glutamate epimerase-like enolase superfamily enzyme
MTARRGSPQSAGAPKPAGAARTTSPPGPPRSRRLAVAIESWELRTPFRTARETVDRIETVTVELAEGRARGRGEALGVDDRGETAASIAAQIEAVRGEVEGGLDRAGLAALLPAGGARNALDCALWDLEAKRTGVPVWDRLGLRPRGVTTAYTLGLDAPERMAAEAAARPDLPLLKLKLGPDDPVARAAAVRRARPDARLIADANGSWSLDLLRRAAPELARLGVELIEQPLPAPAGVGAGGAAGDIGAAGAAGSDADHALAGYRSPVPLCADESCATAADLDRVAARYQAVNVKLDKAGGLTAALMLIDGARRRGLGLMVGNMLGTSLAMAPAFVVAQHCRWVDLDGPLLLARDREPPIRYDGGKMMPPAAALWG